MSLLLANFDVVHDVGRCRPDLQCVFFPLPFFVVLFLPSCGARKVHMAHAMANPSRSPTLCPATDRLRMTRKGFKKVVLCVVTHPKSSLVKRFTFSSASFSSRVSGEFSRHAFWHARLHLCVHLGEREQEMFGFPGQLRVVSLDRVGRGQARSVAGTVRRECGRATRGGHPPRDSHRSRLPRRRQRSLLGYDHGHNLLSICGGPSPYTRFQR